MQKRTSIFIPLLVAALGVATVARGPHADAIRVVDYVELLASGACIGVAAMALVIQSRGGRS